MHYKPAVVLERHAWLVHVKAISINTRCKHVLPNIDLTYGRKEKSET